MRYALLIEYDGTGFHGSQLQKGVRTVQGDLEDALAKIYDSGPRISMAGRTDAGVHASGQVAVFDAEDVHAPSTLREALNFHLASDVAVRAVETVAAAFDPRRDAIRREYIFALNDGSVRSPLNRYYEVRTKELKNLAAMKSAAEVFVGTHDFASFAGPAAPADRSTVRRIDAVTVERTAEHTVTVAIVGNAFVHQQVRRMTGALVRVGAGQLDSEALRELVENPRRGAAGWPLGPQGLRLARIEYENSGPFRRETEYN